jgi:predicted DNA-binding transcriptional regulator YafY
MTARALDRLERVLVMVPWLLEHQGATFDEVAARFGTSPEQVAADLDVLGYCGLPGYGGGDLVEVTTFGDAITIRMADFFRRPLRLSLREAVTLLLAARSFAQVQGLAESPALRRAVERLEDLVGAGAPVDPGDIRMAVDVRAEGDEFLPPLRQALEGRRVVRLTYRSASRAQTTVRDVEPWALVGRAGAWYLRAWCRSAIGRRDFRLDRVVELQVLDETVPARPREEPGPVAVYEPASDDPWVVIDLERSAWWLGERLAAEPATPAEGGWRTYRFQVRELDWLARRLLPFGSRARVVAPAELADRLGQLARRLRELYAPPPDSTTS